MQHSKGITVGTYTVKTKKKVNSLPICPTCKKCKDRKICSNRKKLSKCSICKNCKNAEQCDISYITTCSKAILNLGRSPQTGKEIKKSFTGKTEDEALYKLYQFKDEVKKNGLLLESSVNSYLKKVAKDVELSYWKHFSSHRLRHTFATRCIEAGITLPVLQTLKRISRILKIS